MTSSRQTDGVPFSNYHKVTIRLPYGLVVALEMRPRLSGSLFTVALMSHGRGMVGLSRWVSSKSCLEVDILSLSRAGGQLLTSVVLGLGK